MSFSDSIFHRRTPPKMADPLSSFVATRPDPHQGPEFNRALLRAEALRRARWQTGEWERLLASHLPGTPCLIACNEWAKIVDCLDLLREAGEEIPTHLYPRGSLVRSTDPARGMSASVSVAGLLANITRVLAWYDQE